MAEPANGANVLEGPSHIPIADLTPSLLDIATKSIKAVITLTWPYSSVTGTVAFLLSEPDFRLRRSRGQVRVQFSGPSAKAVTKSGIASGDKVILSLDGVEWVPNEAAVTTPGRGVEFELKFAERLLLEFKQEDSEEVKKIDINHPEPEVESPLSTAVSVVEIETASFILTPQKRHRPDTISQTSDEYSSPAFIKRARTSYGSLFDSDYDPFEEEDGTRPGKGRKRTRLSSTWRYSSRSPSPEVKDVTAELPTSRPDEDFHEAPSMMDEACQTIGLEEGNAAETLANFTRQAINVGGISYPRLNGTTLREEPEDETITDSHQLDNQDVNQELPEARISPALQPLHLDSLPIVSPLVTTKFEYSPNESEEIEVEVQSNQQHPNLKEQVSVPLETRTAAAEDDIYNASLPGRRISSTLFAPVNSNEHTPEPDVLYDHLLQGQGDSVMAQLNHDNGGSPSRESEALDGQENYVSDSIVPSVGLDSSGVSQYPNPNNRFQPHTTSTWGSNPSVVYPSLPAFDGRDEEKQEIHLAPPLPQAAAMSRSQSAHSTAIDLTESSGEEEVEGECIADENEYEDSGMEEAQRFSATRAQRNSPQHTEVFNDGQEEYEEEESYSDRNRQSLDRGEDEEEQCSRYDQEDSVEGEEEYSDEEVEEPHHPLARDPRLQEDYEDDEDEEVESYDGDEMEERGAPAQHEKIVIDLLSSDEDEEDEEDEEDKDDISPLPTRRLIITSEDSIVQRPVHPHLAEEEEESEGSEENEEDEEDDVGGDMEVEEDAPYLAPQSQRSIDSDNRELQSGDEDEDAVYEDDDQMEIEEDEENSIVEVEEQEMVEQSMFDEDRAAPIEKDLMEEAIIKSHKFEPRESNQNSHVSDVIEKKTDAERSDAERSDANALTDRLLDQLAKPPPERPSLFSRVFNLDGANDERFEGLYPKLPRNNSTPPPASDEEADPQSPAAESSEQKQDQLPTPDATQLSQKLVSAEVSFSGTNVIPSDGTTHAEVEREEPEDLEEDSASVIEVIEVITDLPESLQPTLAPASPMSEQMTTNEQQDLEIANSQDNRFEADTIAPAAEDSSVDNGKNLVESEAVETTKDTVEISIEELMGEETEENEFVNKLTDELVAQHIIVEGAITRSKTRQKNEHMELTAREPEYTAEAPRRSHRRVKSTTSSVHTEEEAHSITLVKPEVAKDPATLEKVLSSPMVVVNSSQATPKGHDASIELALSSLESPSKPQRELRTSPIVDLKLKLSRTLRTELSEFTSLKVLRYHINQKLDVLAVATTSPPEPQRAKNGPRHYQITFNITDPSIAPSGVSEVQIFRPYKEALPKILAGDGILLRNFQVISVKGRGGFALRSSLDEGSSWVVFKDGEEDQIRGPPVEYGSVEKNHILALKAWYGTLDLVAKAKITRANGDKQK